MLAPKTLGQSTIPAIGIGSDYSLPITITVQPAQDRTTDDIEAVFVESTIDHTSLYVQQQLLYTVADFSRRTTELAEYYPIGG